MKKILPTGFILTASAILLVSLGLVSCNNNTGGDGTGDDSPAVATTPSITYSVANKLPHDTANFTEGLEFYKGKLIESTGLEGKSKLVLYDLTTGKIDKSIKLDSASFGEGVSVFRDTVYQLTYRESKVNVYDVKDFRKIKELPFTGEGWGLTHDSAMLIATNGSNNLYYYQPATFKLIKKVEVLEGNSPVPNLNEVEYINGFVYANQWQAPYLYKINPTTGEVVAKMDLSSVIQQETATNPKAEVLNGIAYDPVKKKFYVTGKNWSRIYEIQFAF